jgi:hypothetical protein
MARQRFVVEWSDSGARNFLQSARLQRDQRVDLGLLMTPLRLATGLRVARLL